jgi:hypothetical protein
VEHWKKSWQKLTGTGQVLMFTDIAFEELMEDRSARRPSKDECAALLRWVERGNTVLIYGTTHFSPKRSMSDLVEALELEFTDTGSAEPVELWQHWQEPVRQLQTTRDLVPGTLTHGARQVTVEPAGAFRLATGSVVPVARDEAGQWQSFWVPRGAGRVVFFATSAWISNDAIAKTDNLAVLLNALRGVQGTIWFDEYHHGHSVNYALGDFLALPMVKFAGAQLALVIGLVIYSNWRRFGPPVSLARDTRRSVMEYTVSLGDLYRRAATQAEALAFLYQHLRRDLAGRFGLPASAAAADIGSRLAFDAAARREWEQLAGECEDRLATRQVTPRQFAQLAERMQQLRRRMV